VTSDAEADRRDPTLDGIRGIAIALVMLFHFARFESGHSRLGNVLSIVPAIGWSGVDLFFVLSGFLITGILLRTRSGSSYYRAFYGRRVLRIFPLYYATLVFFLVVAPRLTEAGPQDRVGEPIWYWLFLNNVYEAYTGRFQHWALATTWPFLVRHCSDRTLLAVCGRPAPSRPSGCSRSG